jgi:hypothetical protein
MYLGTHPKVYAPGVKEPHFHARQSTGLPTWGVASSEEYEALYRNAEFDQKVVDSSAWNLYCEPACKLIHTLNPEARVIISLRSPVERAYSQYLHMIQRGWEGCATFEDALAKEKDRICEGAFWHYHYASVGFYAAQVQRFIDLFGSDRVMVIIFEAWTKRPELYLDEVYRFIQVEPGQIRKLGDRENVTEIPLSHVMRQQIAAIPFAARFLNDALPSSLRVRARCLLARFKIRKPTMRPSVRKELLSVFQDDIRELEQLLSLDLSQWRLEP